MTKADHPVLPADHWAIAALLRGRFGAGALAAAEQQAATACQAELSQIWQSVADFLRGR